MDTQSLVVYLEGHLLGCQGQSQPDRQEQSDLLVLPVEMKSLSDQCPPPVLRQQSLKLLSDHR